MRILRARLLAQAQHDADEKASASAAAGPDRRPVRAGPHLQLPGEPHLRPPVGYKAYNLDQVVDGDLDAVIDSLADAEMAEKLGDDGNSGA